jgi:hypothetical protein
MSFMSGIPRIKPNIGKIKKASFFQGAAERYLQNRDNEKQQAIEEAKLELDRQGLANQEMAYQIQLQNAQNTKQKNIIDENFKNKQIELAKGITELPNFFYLNEAGERESFTYVNPTVGRTGDDAKMNPSDYRNIVLQINDFLDPNLNSDKLLKNKLNAISGSKVFNEFLVKNVQEMSKATKEEDVNTGLDSTVFHGAIITPVNNFTNQDDFKNLIDNFTNLPNRGMSLRDYMIQLQEQGFTDAGIDIKNADYNNISFIVDDQGRATLYDDVRSAKSEIPAGSVLSAKNMFQKSAEEEDFRKKILVFRAKGNLNTDPEVISIGSVIGSEAAKKYIDISKIGDGSGPTSSEMLDVAKFISTLATDFSKEKVNYNTGQIRNTDETKVLTRGLVNAYIVQNATKYGDIIEKGGKLYLKTNPRYAKQKIDLDKNTKLKNLLLNNISVSEAGYKDINVLFGLDAEMEQMLVNRVADGSITEAEADEFREYKIGESVTGTLFDSLMTFKEQSTGIFKAIKGMAAESIAGDRSVIDSFEGNDELNAKGNQALLLASTEYTGRIEFLNQQYENNKIDKDFYNKRIKAEGIKIRLAFKLASIVQGGGTGGRTISNQDYDVIIKSLYGKTNSSFKESLAYVRHVLFRTAEVNRIFQEYADTGFQQEVSDVAGNYIDADYNMRTDSRLTTYSPNKDSLVQIQEAESNLNTKNQQAFMNNIIGSDPKRLTNIIDNFGNSQSDSFIGLGTNSQRLIIGSIPSVNLTPTRKRQKAKVFKNFSSSILLPHIIIDRKNQNIPVNDDLLLKSLTSIFNSQPFAQGMLNDFKVMAQVDNLSELGDANAVRKIMTDNLISMREKRKGGPNTDYVLSAANRQILSGVIDEIKGTTTSNVAAVGGAGGAGGTGGAGATGGGGAGTTVDLKIKPDQLITKPVGFGGTQINLELNSDQINAGKKLFDQKMKEFEQYENEDPMGRFGRKIVNGKAMSFQDYSIDAFAEMFGEDIRTDRYYAQFLNQIGQRGVSSTLFGSIF